jgi:hypothetical protein
MGTASSFCEALRREGPPRSPNVAAELERDVDQAIALCGGDLRAALRTMVLANAFLEAEIERLTAAVSVGFTRGKGSPSRQASETLDGWREALGSDDDLEVLQRSPDLPLTHSE